MSNVLLLKFGGLGIYYHCLGFGAELGAQHFEIAKLRNLGTLSKEKLIRD